MHDGGGFILGGGGSFGQRRRRTTATATTTTANNDSSNIDDQNNNNNDPLLRNTQQSQQQQQQQLPSQQQQSQGGSSDRNDLLLNRQETKELDEEDDDLLYDEDIDDDVESDDGGSRSRSGSSGSESGSSGTSGSSTSVNKSSMELRIKCSCFQDAVIAVPKQSTIAEVKRAVVIALGEKAAGRYLRLIARGRLLAPDSSQISDFEFVNDRDVIHAVLAAEGQRGGPQAALQRGLLSHHHHHSSGSSPTTSTTATSGGSATAMGMSRRAFRRGTGINAAGVAVRDVADPNGVDYDDDEEDLLDDMLNRSGSGDNDIEAGGNERSSSLLGFDRLRRNGLGRQEITALRVYFNRHVDRWIRQYPVAAERAAAGETDLVRRRLLQEDAWMSTQGPASELRLNLNLSSFTTATTNPSATTAWAQAQQQAQQQQLLLGGAGGGGRGGSVAASEAVWRAGGMSAAVGTDRDFMWGFMLGFFVGFLMLVWVWMPTVPHKQKLGILTGISFQLALGMIKGSADDQPTDDVMGE